MDARLTFRYPATCDRVAVMYASADYQRERVLTAYREGQGDVDRLSELLTCTVTGDPQEGWTSTVQATVRAHELLGSQMQSVPAGLRRMIPESVHVTVTEQWSAPAPDGSRRGQLSVACQGAPVSLSADGVMAAPSGEDTASCTVTFRGELRVAIPLLGRSVEAAALRSLGTLEEHEQACASAWLSQH